MRVKVLSNLKHDGKFYAKDQVVDLDDDAAEQLVKDEVVESTDAELTPEETETPESKPDETPEVPGENTNQPPLETAPKAPGQVGEQTYQGGQPQNQDPNPQQPNAGQPTADQIRQDIEGMGASSPRHVNVQ